VTKVFFDFSMSLDGYMTASGQTPEEPMGPGGDQLVAWAFGEDERDRQVLLEGVAGTGAVIAGRRTYDTSLPWWGADGPTGNARVPVFVVTHDPPADAPEGGVYTFVTGGIELALEQAKAPGDEPIRLEQNGITGTAAATHLRLRVVRQYGLTSRPARGVDKADSPTSFVG
jgi:dihydrofolate reductase